MYYRIASIILSSGQKNTESEIFISQPDSEKENLAGKLFAIIEIESKKSDTLKIINFLINNLNYNYYQNEKIILRERIESLKVGHIFESSLAKTNKDLANFLLREKIKLVPEKTNITAGVIYKNELYFSNFGKNKALIIYKDKESKKNNRKNEEEEIKYKIANIKQEESSVSNSKKNNEKMFSNVINGSIPTNGYFIFTNETMPEYLSNKQLVEIITKLPPAGAAEQIKNILSKINAYVSFLGIIIKNTTGEQKSFYNDSVKIKSSAENSIISLNETEENTEKFLKLSGSFNLKEKIKKIKTLFFKKNDKINENNKIFLLKEKIFLKRKRAFVPMRKVFSFLKMFFLFLISFISYIFVIFTNKEKSKEFFKKIATSLSLIIKIIKDKLNGLKNLNKISKILLILLLIILIFFFFNLYSTKTKNKEIEKKETINSLVEDIEKKQNQIDANLLYNNEKGAKDILVELKDLFDQLNKDTEGKNDKYKDLFNKYEDHLKKIRHVVNIDNAKELADFSKLNSSAKTSNIILLNEKIYSGDGEQKTIYKIDIKNGSITAIADLGIDINDLKNPVADKDNNIYYLSDNKIIRLDSETEEMLEMEINIPEDTISSASFNNRLYLLSRKNNQIYRYNIGEKSFTNEYKWINNPEDLLNSSGMSIDGSVYVLEKDGKILKYLKGEKEIFGTDEVEPKLTDANKIKKIVDSNYFYVLETINNRLIVFGKSGEFLMQYQGENFKDLKDFEVDEANKKIYILNGASVYEIEGKHF